MRDSHSPLEVEAGEHRMRINFPRLKAWMDLRQLQDQVGADTWDSAIVAFLEQVTGWDAAVWDQVAWFDALAVYLRILVWLRPNLKLPSMSSKRKDEEKAPWDYSERPWFALFHRLAKFYGWEEAQIAGLEVETALALLQEISVDEQLEREFIYGLSEVAYPYNEATKKSVFRPLPRPEWMQPEAKPPKKIKVRLDMLPMGNVVDISGAFKDEATQFKRGP